MGCSVDKNRFIKNDKGELQLKYEAPKVEESMVDPIAKATEKMNKVTSDKLHALIAMRILPAKIDPANGTLRNSLDVWAEEHLPLYAISKDVITDTWANSEVIQSMKTYIKPSGTGLYSAINKLVSIDKKAKEEHLEMLDNMLRKIDSQITKAGFKEKDIALADDVFANSGFFGLTYNNYGGDLAAGKKDIKTIIAELEQQINNKEIIYNAKQLSNIYLGKPSNNGHVNINHSLANKAIKPALEALTAAYALEMIPDGVSFLQNTYTNHRELYNSLAHLALENKAMHQKILDNNPEVISKGFGNLAPDIIAKPKEIRAVHMNDLMTKKEYSEKEGWKVLRQPGKGTVGLVYRDSVSNFYDGVASSVSYMKGGIPLHNAARDTENPFETFSKDNTLALNGTTPITYLTAEEKAILGYEKHPGKTLTKSWAHSHLILETQAVRDHLLENMTEKLSGTAKSVLENLHNKIESKEHPLFLNITELTEEELNNLGKDKVFQNTYTLVNSSILSDINGFDKQIQYVRKDLASEVIGFDTTDMLSSYRAKQVYHGVTSLIRYAKTNMIIPNIPKILSDTISGITNAMVEGASIQEVIKYGKEATTLSEEMVKLRNKEVALKVQLALETDEGKRKKLEEQIKAIQKNITEHAFSPALSYGFVTSLSTEMLAQERMSTTGVQATMDALIQKMTKDKDGNFTKFNEQVKRFANAGIDISAVFGMIGNKLDENSNIGEALKSITKDLQNAKSKEDMKDYIGQFLLTPNSWAVRVGSAATLYADLIPKWVMYRTFMNRGDSSDKAAEKALNAGLDYKMKMPPALQFMSDLYLTPFPSFWVRIQRVLATQATDKPVAFAANLLNYEMGSALGFQTSILASNIFSKLDKDSMFMSPLDILIPTNFIPFHNLFGF